MITKPLFSSASDEWNTPQNIIDRVLKAFQAHEVDLDPCSNATSKVPARTKVMLPNDGLAVDWTEYGTVFVNPPYSQINAWAKKICEYCGSDADSGLIALVPARTDTKWFHSLLDEYPSFCMLRGRVKFEGSSSIINSAPFPSVAFFFTPHYDYDAHVDFADAFSGAGYCCP